jgi:hypothetical protein
MYEIRKSGGTRSVNLPVLVAAGYSFGYYGILGFSKHGMLAPMVAWLLPVAALRYRLSMAQVAGGVVTAFVVFYYLVPYAQYARSNSPESPSFSGQIGSALTFLSHPQETRELYLASQADIDMEEATYYYNTPQGFWDRLQFISVDDSLIDITDNGKVFGLSPVTATFLNVIPRVFWPNKPSLGFGNVYAHEIGNFADDDTTTGISFSPTAEAYHMKRWTGVLVVAPLIWLFVFYVFDSLCGDTRSSAWGLFAVLSISHTAPEGALTGAIYLATYGALSLVFAAFFAAWIAPICSVVVLGVARKPLLPPPALRGPLAARPRLRTGG